MGTPIGAFEYKVNPAELGGMQLFRQVNPVQIAPLLRLCPTLMLAPGERLIVPGQPNQLVYLVLQGSLRVHEGTQTTQTVGMIQRGECIGLSSFVDRQPCHVTIVSNENCRLLVLDEERLSALINTPTMISRNLVFILMKYLRNKARQAPAAAPTVAPLEPIDNHKNIDPVTGLHNQNWLNETLDRVIMRAATDRKPLSVVAAEIDDLNELTAKLGPEMSDLSLRELAGMLGNTLRPTDLTARHASGRFVILLPDTDQVDAEALAGRIMDKINQSEVVIPGVCRLPAMKISVGCVQMKAFVSGRKLLDDAFSALAKQRELNAQRAAAELLPEPLPSESEATNPGEHALEVQQPMSMEPPSMESPAPEESSLLEPLAESLAEPLPESLPEPFETITDAVETTEAQTTTTEEKTEGSPPLAA